MKRAARLFTLVSAVLSLSLSALAQEPLYKPLSTPKPTPKPRYLKITTPKYNYLKNNYKSPYSKTDSLTGSYGQPKRTSKSGKLKPGQETVDINMATVTELTRIPGIGPKTAENIVNYRHGVGQFNSLEDLLEVKGIGKKTLEKLRPFVSL